MESSFPLKLDVSTKPGQLHILFIDGFAGPGEYRNGEEGSPLIAMRALADHNAQHVINAEVVFIFIEKKPDRVQRLQHLVEEWRPRLPGTARVHVIKDTFDRRMTEALDGLEEAGTQLAPAFLMIDPFGVEGFPMEIVQRILANRSCEVYVTFMWESINRFLPTQEFENHLSALFGTEEWNKAIALKGKERRRLLYDLYEEQLRDAGAKHVVHFDLYDSGRNRLVYSIFFGTQHVRGSDRMKAAIWKAAPHGDFVFRGNRDEQLMLPDLATPDFDPLREALLNHFGIARWVTIEEIRDFVASDRTSYHTGQIKTPVLKPMEHERLVEVDPNTRTRRFEYPRGCRIRFLRSPEQTELDL